MTKDDLEEIANVPSVNVFVDKIVDMWGISENSYELLLTSDNEVHITKPHKDFIDGLKIGDKVLIVTQENTTKLVYGPLKEDRLYRLKV